MHIDKMATPGVGAATLRGLLTVMSAEVNLEPGPIPNTNPKPDSSPGLN